MSTCSATQCPNDCSPHRVGPQGLCADCAWGHVRSLIDTTLGDEPDAPLCRAVAKALDGVAADAIERHWRRLDQVTLDAERLAMRAAREVAYGRTLAAALSAMVSK